MPDARYGRDNSLNATTIIRVNAQHIRRDLDNATLHKISYPWRGIGNQRTCNKHERQQTGCDFVDGLSQSSMILCAHNSGQR